MVTLGKHTKGAPLRARASKGATKMKLFTLITLLFLLFFSGPTFGALFLFTTNRPDLFTLHIVSGALAVGLELLTLHTLITLS
jgi:hypothetical protein